MAKHLATFNDIINDIEITGFVIMSEKEVETYEDLASSITWSFKYKIGDEKLEYSSGEDLLTRIDFREISSEEAKTFKKLFNNEFGTFISEEFLETIADDEEEDDTDIDDDDNDDYRYRDYDNEDDDY